MLASQHPSPALIAMLLTLSPSPTTLLAAADNDGNTALHHACAYGQLKSIGVLLESGASAGARNAYSWTPVSYCMTVGVEVGFKGLVAEGERRREGRRGGGGGVRVVDEGS